MKDLFAKANDTFGKKYGVTIETGGTTGESVANGGRITASLNVGGPHETVHALQQMQTRVAMLERQAAKLGKPVEKLSQAERASAFKQAELFEKASYAQHEMQAMYATGFGGGGKAQYARYLSQSMDDLGVALREGTVISGKYGAGAQFYGRFGAAMGASQEALVKNTATSGYLFVMGTNNLIAGLLQ